MSRDISALFPLIHVNIMSLYAKAQPMDFLPISWDFRSEIEGNFSLTEGVDCLDYLE